MTEETEVAPEVEDDLEIEMIEDETKALYVSDGEFVIFDHEAFADEHGAIGVMQFGGTIYLLLDDMKMHRLEIVPYAKKAAPSDKPTRLRSIRPEPTT